MDASSPAAVCAKNAGEGYFLQPTVIADILPRRAWSRKKFSVRCWP